MTADTRSFFILTRDGKVDAGQEAKLAALEARLNEPGARFLLHLHGGLVNEPDGMAAATRLAGRGPGSWDRDERWTQLYIVWRTGAMETLRTNWRDLVHNDRLYQALLSKLLRFVARRLGVPSPGISRSIGDHFDLSEAEVRRLIVGNGSVEERRNPFGDIETHFHSATPDGSRAAALDGASPTQLADAFEAELDADPEFQAAAASLDATVNAGLPGRAAAQAGDIEDGLRSYSNFSSAVQAAIGPVDTLAARSARGPISVTALLIRHGGRIAWRCFERFRTQRDHGFHATLVEELCRELYGDIVGAAIWAMMLRDARDHFAQTGYGAALLAMLARAPQPERFILSGHSAGSIWAAEMLLAMKQAGIDRPARLSLLAPAVRHDLFAKLITSAGGLIESCHMATMDDVHERKDALLGPDLGYIYPSSLLYCVSGLFENRGSKPYPDTPIVGMRRFADAAWLDNGERADADAIADFFARTGNGVMLSPTAGVTAAVSHGSFDDEPMTLASVAALF